ncbi:SseB family protein, partial [Streptomyces sp. NPDC057654]|uniref:SseB family protein n=1 Tax=Streptomyces sp. NPDC057654 TaxID=3346196 RepID=UPI003675E8DA
MSIPESYGHTQAHGWPANELEEVLTASLGVPDAGARIVEVLGRSMLWIPLPNGGSPQSRELDLPTLEIDGGAYVPVFSSEQQFRMATGDRMACTVAPAVEFARGLPPQLGLESKVRDIRQNPSRARLAPTGLFISRHLRHKLLGQQMLEQGAVRQ